MFSLELPHQGDSNEYTQYTIFNMKKRKITLNYPTDAALGFFQGTQERIRTSRGKRAISVRAIEVLLYHEVLSYLSKELHLNLMYNKTCSCTDLFASALGSKYHQSSVIRQSFLLPKHPQKSRPIL